MKKYIFILFAILFSGFVMTSCGDDDTIDPKKIVGYWQYIRKDYVFINSSGEIVGRDNRILNGEGLAFFSDGTYIESWSNGKYTKTGTWVLDGDLLIEDDEAEWPYRVALCTDDALALEYHVGWFDGENSGGEQIETYHLVRVSAQEWADI